MRLVNRSGYDTGDLRAFFERAFRTYGVDGRDVTVTVVAAPKRSRGCAEVGSCGSRACVPGKRMAIAIAPPSYNRTYHAFLRRLAHLLRHECAHIRGLDHKDMAYDLLYSLGPVPNWARGARIRYRGRAPNQMGPLGRSLDD
jgi:hypothetical protein